QFPNGRLTIPHHVADGHDAGQRGGGGHQSAGARQQPSPHAAGCPCRQRRLATPAQLGDDPLHGSAFVWHRRRIVELLPQRDVGLASRATVHVLVLGGSSRFAESFHRDAVGGRLEHPLENGLVAAL